MHWALNFEGFKGLKIRGRFERVNPRGLDDGRCRFHSYKKRAKPYTCPSVVEFEVNTPVLFMPHDRVWPRELDILSL